LAGLRQKRNSYEVGIGELAPHDLRRTAAKLCSSKGGELDGAYGCLWSVIP
jgi:hypothetical protein